MASGSPLDILLAAAMRAMVAHAHFLTYFSSVLLGGKKEAVTMYHLPDLNIANMKSTLNAKVFMGDKFVETRYRKDF